MELNFECFLKFYKENESKLIFEDGLRPAKSLTRNIFSCVDKFKNWYLETKKTIVSQKEIEDEICKLSESGQSTIADNIRGMIEIKFLTDFDEEKNYKFTKEFIQFIYGNISLEDYIINKLESISCLDDINMFQNYILATLREGLLNGYIVSYPDSYSDFESTVPSKEERIKICTDVYLLYGFSGRGKSPSDANYTPNINYRILSTCRHLNLININEDDKYDSHGFPKFVLTMNAKMILDKINNNIKNKEIMPESIIEELTKNGVVESENSKIIVEPSVVTINSSVVTGNDTKNVFEDLYDELYIAQSNNLDPEPFLHILDLPVPLANKFSRATAKRDPQKAANAKVAANYLCEFDNCHMTFTSKANNENYVEAHHLVPIQLQSCFLYSLDVESNIVSLCPVCHRKIHLATSNEKREIITKLYKSRINRLKECNIMIELEDLIKFYS